MYCSNITIRRNDFSSGNLEFAIRIFTINEQSHIISENYIHKSKDLTTDLTSSKGII